MKAQAAIADYLDREALLKKEFAGKIQCAPHVLSRWLGGSAIPSGPYRRKITELIGENVNREGDWKPPLHTAQGPL